MNTKICPICKSPIPAHAPGGFCPACVLRAAEEPAPGGRTAPSLAEVAAAFPQLEVRGLIGQGGMGFVYKVRQPSLDRTVALKILSPALGRDPAFAERFAREARVLGKLNHPNIVTVFEHGESAGFFYLLMEFVDGVNLRQAMRAGRFTPPQALAVVPGICDALQAAHAQGVWHRDIKPENILLDARGGVKIADFGIARIVGDPARDFTLTATGAALGSAAYMAPEQHESPHDVDHRADIYSLGVVIYEMLTGELPLGRFPAPSQRAAVSARIDEIVLQTLEKEREFRQQSATEVKTDVQRAARTAGDLTTPSRRDRQPAPLTLWSLGLLLGGSAMSGAAAVFTSGSTQGVLLTFASVASVLGFVAACIALFQMRHAQIPTAWRPLLRALVWVPTIALAVGSIALPALFVARSGAVRHAAESARASAALQAAAQAQASADQAKAEALEQQASATPPVPTVPVEEVFRKMNAFANESNGQEFKKYMSKQGPRRNPIIINGTTRDTPIAAEMEPFFGRILLVKRAPMLPAEYTKTAGIFATIERNDKTIDYLMFWFTAEEGEWRYRFVERSEYRASSHIEFRPEKGDAAVILRTHLVPSATLAPVPGTDGQFDIQADDYDPESAAETANKNVVQLQNSLKKVGLDAVFKIIAPAKKPEKPWLAEDAPALENKKP